MKPYRYLSSVEQLADHLRGEIQRGELIGDMPGVDKLAEMLGCSQKTVLGALKQLEQDGILVKQGAGRASRINLQGGTEKATLRVQLLLFDREEGETDITSRYVTRIRLHLENAGHSVTISSKTLHHLGMNVKRVANHVGSVETDAWVVASASREVLKWFSEQPKPTFALFGRRRGLSIASVGPDKVGAYRATTRSLIELGHKRVMLLARPDRRLPEPGFSERAFLEELEQSGIITGSYNLPDWDGSVGGLHKVLDTAFRYSPPTAMIIDEPQIFLSVQHDLARRGILAPEHVSLVCTDYETYFEYIRPSVAHILFPTEPWARRITKWANRVANGVDDRRQSLTKAQFVKGGTVGPVPSRT